MGLGVEPIVVFDLDRVLVSGNVVALFLGGLPRYSLLRTLLVCCAAPALATAAVLAGLRPVCARAIVWLASGSATTGSSGVSDVFRSALVRRPEAVNADAVACLRAHLAAGQRVVVATAAEETVAGGYLEVLGLAHLDLVASGGRLRPWRVRRVHGQAKVWHLIEGGYPPPWVTVYSDSASDAPLFAGTPRPALVNANRRTVERVRRALGRMPESRTWR